MDPMDDKLSALWAEYREAFPDPEAGPQFLPQLWQRIEANSSAKASELLRRWAEVWLVATVMLALLMGVVLIPRYQNAPAYQASYIDVLSAADSASDAAVVPASESE